MQIPNVIKNIPLTFLLVWMSLGQTQAQAYKPIDARATRETKALYQNLHKLSKKHSLFGHQHATEYGHGWAGEANRSDVKSVTGSHPAVIGVDFSGFSGRPPAAIQQAKESGALYHPRGAGPHGI
jgi:mannan endo-1,4-beta-mannosidase